MELMFHMGPARTLGIELLAVSWEFQSERTKQENLFLNPSSRWLLACNDIDAEIH